MKILVIGSGGRESAFVWKFVLEGHEVFCAPGNPGTAEIATNVARQVTDIPGLLKFAQDNHIDLTMVGPEEPLFLGIVDVFEKHGLRIVGPTAAAAQIEKSKAFARGVMLRARIAQPQHAIFNDYEKALVYVRERNIPCFVKASGPALGKGALPCKTVEEAEAALQMLMVEKKFGVAGKMVLIEEWLDGYELSAHALCHKRTSLLFPFVQDNKYSGDGDTGTMSGGMGTVLSPSLQNEEIASITKTRIVQGILDELSAETPYKGIFFPGLMVTKNDVKTLEGNARAGDPETQVLVRHLDSPGLAEMLIATIDGGLDKIVPVWKTGSSVCVVMATKGYANAYKHNTGMIIEGIEHAEEVRGVKVFHAGTEKRGEKLVNIGGRVLSVTCYAEDLDLAIGRAYKAVKRIKCEALFCRWDIGHKLLANK